jgi:hypothetical protein
VCVQERAVVEGTDAAGDGADDGGTGGGRTSTVQFGLDDLYDEGLGSGFKVGVGAGKYGRRRAVTSGGGFNELKLATYRMEKLQHERDMRAAGAGAGAGAAAEVGAKKPSPERKKPAKPSAAAAAAAEVEAGQEVVHLLGGWQDLGARKIAWDDDE